MIVRVRAVQTGDGAHRREDIAELVNDLRVARKCRQDQALGTQPPAHASCAGRNITAGQAIVPDGILYYDDGIPRRMGYRAGGRSF